MKSFMIRTKGPTAIFVDGDVIHEGVAWCSVYAELPNGQRRVVALVPSSDVDHVTERKSPA